MTLTLEQKCGYTGEEKKRGRDGVNLPKKCRAPKKDKLARPAASFSIVIAEKPIQYIQVKYMAEKSKLVNAEAEENSNKAEFNFLVVLGTIVHKNLVDPKVLQLKNCLHINQKERAPESLSPVFTKRIRSTFCQRQNCNTRGVEETSGRRTAFRTSLVVKNAS